MAFVDNKASSSKSATGAKGKGGKGKPAQPRSKTNQAKRLKIDEELKELQAKVDSWIPPAEITLFNELPLSSRTLKGLKSSHFLNPTPIQQLAIPPALRGQDLLGSAKTGSGKTLAFLIPMLERLYLDKWGPMDGLGAVVISPTRELAVQTFNQLRDIGKYHNFSAGLVIGGKPLKEEQERLGRMNILIATPGRLLQHLDSTVGFESSGVKVLVLDEADRLLDLGFLPALRAIIGHFSPGISTSNPSARPTRQTLLFSATQTKDLAALAKLSLYQPEYINCNKAGEEGVVPSNLEQYYAVVGLERKLDTLWGFVKSHLKMKGIVFVTSGKQVRFIFETFKRLHPGLPLMHLHGKQKQATRLTIFQKYSSSKHALLICTDVAARGLDFPAVDWVIQLDCPDDVDTYIHRIGRTARYQAGGHALTFLCPSEEQGMLDRFKEKMLDVKKIKIKQSKMGNLKQQMQNFAFREPEIKYLGQRAFISYMKSVHIQKDKFVFKLSELPVEAFAESMGLPGAPQIKFAEQKASKVRGGQKKDEIEKKDEEEVRVEERGVVGSDDESDEDEEETSDEGSDEEEEEDVDAGDKVEDESESESESDSSSSDKPKSAPAVRTKYDRMFERKNQSILTPHYTALVSHGEAEDEEAGDDDVFTLARKDHNLSDDDDEGSDGELLKVAEGKETTAITGLVKGSEKPLISSEDLSKRKLKAATSKKSKLKTGGTGEKLIFDEVTGESRNFYETGKDVENQFMSEAKRREYLEEQREKMKVANEVDKLVAKEKRNELKRKRKEREREMRKEYMSDEDADGPVAYIGGVDHGDNSDIDERSPSPSPEPEVEVRNKKKRKNKFKPDVEEELESKGRLEDDEELALRLLQGS
ncbi:ATP-dependent RNA helicase DBP4 [Kwoniella sp. B9012]